MKYINWEKNSGYNKGYNTNKLIAEKNYKSSSNTIVKAYTQIQESGVLEILKNITNIRKIFSGIGVDVGGGVALISATIAKNFKIDKIYCVEYVEEVVKLCHPIVKKNILEKNFNQVQSIVGDFDNLQLPNNSIDFMISWDSLHHSENPVKTLNECKRVLKDNGFLVIVDKSHNNSVSDDEIINMLDYQYDKEFLKLNNLDTNTILFRKDEGEHEYRFYEWENFFENAGFKIIQNFLIKTETPSNLSKKNDNELKEIFVKFNVGGFQQQKAVYVLQPN
jgi:ubiquinone/menaquinone biosynthesis C-methylase UbiE|tara:strand:- start:1861 stop:2694 length:834 start_codon:yes stop_codon:yes gene_type:complete